MWILRFLLVLYEQGETELDNVLDVLLNRDGNPNNEVIGDIVMDSGEWGRHNTSLDILILYYNAQVHMTSSNYSSMYCLVIYVW